MGSAALLVALMAVAGVKGQDGESIATSFLSGQLFHYLRFSLPVVVCDAVRSSRDFMTFRRKTSRNVANVNSCTLVLG